MKTTRSRKQVVTRKMDSGHFGGSPVSNQAPYDSKPGASQAYGSSGATGQFDPYVFIRKPQVIARLVSCLFSVVVFSCISSKGWEKDVCKYGDSGACGYGVGVGVLAFLILIVFLVSDVLFDNMSNVLHRKYVVIADILVSGFWTFLWFVCFCYMTDKWRTTQDTVKAGYTGRDTIQAAIAFSFFSILSFAAITVLAVLRYRQGVSQDIANAGYNSDPTSGFDGFTP